MIVELLHSTDNVWHIKLVSNDDLFCELVRIQFFEAMYILSAFVFDRRINIAGVNYEYYTLIDHSLPLSSPRGEDHLSDDENF